MRGGAMKVQVELLEREAELAAIEAALAWARSGDGALLVIEGEAGAGKTSLLAAAADRATAAATTVLRARGGEYERDFPYGVMRQLLEPALAAPVRRAELLRGTAGLVAPLFEAGTGRSDPFTLQHGLYWLLVELASEAPLALHVDDAQWADPASLRALLYAARRLEGLPVALLLTVRTGAAGEGLGPLEELRREPAALTVPLPPLSVAATATLIAGHRSDGTGPGLADACHEATAGNPLLLVELLSSLELDRLGFADHSAERLAELAASGVSGSIRGRLAQLGEDAVAVARAVAVLEPNAELRRVAALAALPPAGAAAACERLVAAQMLFDERPLAFVHPLVRAAVLSNLSATARAGAHARAARLLHEDGAERDSVAAHLLLAEPAADAWALAELRAAAADALRRGAPDAAVRYLRRALDEPPPRPERAAVSHELGTGLLIANDPEGLDLLRAVRADSADPAKRALLAGLLATSLGLRGRQEEGAALLEESLAEVGDDDSERSLYVRGSLLMQSIWGLERVPAGAMLRDGERPGAERRPGRLLLQNAAVLTAYGLGSPARGRELAERVAAAGRERLLEDGIVGLPAHAAAAALVLADRGDRAATLVELAIEALRARGSAGFQGSYGLRGTFAFLEGDLRDAQADLEIAVPIVDEAGLLSPAATCLSAIAATMLARGAATEAEAIVARRWAGREPPRGTVGSFFLATRGDLHRAAGRLAKARDDYLAAGERVRWLPLANGEIFGWRTGLALCEAGLGDPGEGRRLAAEAVAIAAEADNPRALGIALRTQGLLAVGDEGIELLREAVATLEGTRARLRHAEALVDLGAAMRRARHRREAREPLRLGLDLAHRCGAAPLEERARAELAAAGARPRQAALSGVGSLTPSELRVAGMAAAGMSNREIAQELFVTPKTIETHLRHAYQKLDVPGRGGLAAALQAGGR